jgi:hypothetical protein
MKMRHYLVSALIALPLTAGVAVAQEARMTRAEFDGAVRCLAYTKLDALKAEPIDVTALEARVEAALASRPAETRKRVREDTREIRQDGARADTPSEIARLKSDRDRACNDFVSAPAAAPAG